MTSYLEDSLGPPLSIRSTMLTHSKTRLELVSVSSASEVPDSDCIAKVPNPNKHPGGMEDDRGEDKFTTEVRIVVLPYFSLQPIHSHRDLCL